MNDGDHTLARIIVALAAAYAIGCIAGAYYVVRFTHGADIRTRGSGNAGARNVLRVGYRREAVLTLLWDVAKGAAAVWLARRAVSAEWIGSAAFAATVAGHVWPAQLGFRGGKGAAPALGAMLAVDPLVTAIGLALGAIAGVVARNATVFAMTALVLGAPIAAASGHQIPSVVAIAAGCAIVLAAHHPSFDRARTRPAAGESGEKRS